MNSRERRPTRTRAKRIKMLLNPIRLTTVRQKLTPDQQRQPNDVDGMTTAHDDCVDAGGGLVVRGLYICI